MGRTALRQFALVDASFFCTLWPRGERMRRSIASYSSMRSSSSFIGAETHAGIIAASGTWRRVGPRAEVHGRTVDKHYTTSHARGRSATLGCSGALQLVDMGRSCSWPCPSRAYTMVSRNIGVARRIVQLDRARPPWVRERLNAAALGPQLPWCHPPSLGRPYTSSMYSRLPRRCMAGGCSGQGAVANACASLCTERIASGGRADAPVGSMDDRREGP